MIDKEKIDEAAEEHIVSTYYGTYAHENDLLYGCAYIKARCKKKDFEAGALWAIEEYKKSLWHDSSEEPNFKRPIIYTGKIFFNHIDSWNCPNKSDWHYLKSNYKDFKWCYSKDILPNDYYKE